MTALVCMGAWFAAGLYVGHYITESRWRSAANAPMRVHSGGALYHVILDGDKRKLHEVLEGS